MHTAATNSTMRIWHLGPVTPRPTFLVSSTSYAPPTSRTLTVSRAANKLSTKCLERKATSSMSVDNAAQDSPSLQLPDVLSTAFAGKHSGCSLRSSVGRCVRSLVNLIAFRTCACFQYVVVDEAGIEGDVAQQDHMSVSAVREDSCPPGRGCELCPCVSSSFCSQPCAWSTHTEISFPQRS